MLPWVCVCVCLMKDKKGNICHIRCQQTAVCAHLIITPLSTQTNKQLTAGCRSLYAASVSHQRHPPIMRSARVMLLSQSTLPAHQHTCITTAASGYLLCKDSQQCDVYLSRGGRDSVFVVIWALFTKPRRRDFWWMSTQVPPAPSPSQTQLLSRTHTEIFNDECFKCFTQNAQHNSKAIVDVNYWPSVDAGIY